MEWDVTTGAWALEPSLSKWHFCPHHLSRGLSTLAFPLAWATAAPGHPGGSWPSGEEVG